MDKNHLYNKYKHGKDLLSAAKHGELADPPTVDHIRNGKGDHVIVYPIGYPPIAVPVGHEIPRGLLDKLLKLFIKAGIIVAVLAIMFMVL